MKQAQSKEYRHLVRNIPNNFLTRWLVKKTNRRMRASESMFRLQKRYRGPREGYRYDSFGSILPVGSYDYETLPPVHKRAKKFSLYLVNR